MTLLRDAYRSLRASPGTSLLIVFALGLGTAANTAVFSVVDAVLFRPMHAQEPERLVRIYGVPGDGTPGLSNSSSFPVYADYREARSFVSVAAYDAGFPVHVSYGSGEVVRLAGGIVTGSFFPTLGLAPAAGRLLGPSDDRAPNGHPVLVLAHRTWRTRFGGDPEAVGSTLRINGQAFTVVGVAPEGFFGTDYESPADLWVPMAMVDAVQPEWAADRPLDNRGFYWLKLLGRLAPGASLETAQAELDVIAKRRAASEPADERDPLAKLAPATDGLLPSERGAEAARLSWVLLGVVGLVLLLACADAGGLLLARAERRAHEIAVRLALGASRRRIVGQLLLESLALSLAGAGLGLWLADAALESLPALAPAEMVLPIGAATPLFDLRVLGFTVWVAVGVTLVFGLLPARWAARTALVPALKSEVRQWGRPKARLGVGGLFVGFQVAVASLVLAASGLLLRTLWSASRVDPGFEVERAVTASIDVARQGLDEARGRVLFDRWLAAVRALPGVKAAGYARSVPVQERGMMVSVEIEGRPAPPGEYPTADFNAAGPGYFDALGVPLVRGRDFTERDAAGAPLVVVVNQAFAARFFPGEDPLGRRLAGVGPLPAAEIVGVVADHRARNLRWPVTPAVFVPHAQLYQASLGLVVRTVGDPRALLADLRRTLGELDPDMPLFAAFTLREKVAATLGQERLLAVLFSAFAALALVLAGSGLFGLAAYTTEGRTREIGVRVALGARPREIVRLVLGQSLGLVAGGLALGLALAALAGRLLVAQLHGVRPSDPWNLLAVAGVLVLTALLACHLPARRALRVDPITALRSE